ncbi:MFS transporter [Pedobacter sp. SYSU D00535]|uniref:MFS transporter n=1 Tax=Pedobacter sp. SYSU D00535 TaxID=2810308 RepID=UPI001A958921|nr:MFS transporter [Pedobacter sp. SYSU D00535]
MSTQSIYTLPFALLCLSSLLFSASFNMLIPELPAYISSLGGAEHKGLIIALFTITAGISRPFSGKLTDTVGRVPIMAVGSIVCFVCGFLYPVLSSVSGFLFLRLLHGFSTGFKPTATSAYIADIIPSSRWGEAMGIHGLCFSTGMAIGPAIGSAITANYSINALFYSSSIFALLSILIVMNMKETVKNKQRFSASLLKIAPSEVIETRVLPSAWVTLLSYFSYGAMLTVVPDWGEHLGITNKGLFFMTFTIASVAIRFVAGKASDNYGRVGVLKISLLMLTVALVLVGMAETVFGFLAASVVYGLATGLLSPANNAWTADLSHPDHRGKAVATMYIALEAGIGLGAFLAGLFFQDEISRVPVIFYASAGVAFLAFLYLLLRTENS